MLEVWNEIKVELEQENIRPVSPDADSMTEITKILNDRAAAVSATQVGHLGGEESWNSYSVGGEAGVCISCDLPQF